MGRMGRMGRQFPINSQGLFRTPAEVRNIIWSPTIIVGIRLPILPIDEIPSAQRESKSQIRGNSKKNKGVLDG